MADSVQGYLTTQEQITLGVVIANGIKSEGTDFRQTKRRVVRGLGLAWVQKRLSDKYSKEEIGEAIENSFDRTLATGNSKSAALVAAVNKGISILMDPFVAERADVTPIPFEISKEDLIWLLGKLNKLPALDGVDDDMLGGIEERLLLVQSQGQVPLPS